MKITKKTVIIIAGALVVLGLILTIAAASLGGLNMNVLGAGYEEKTYTYDSSKVNKLYVRDISCEVVVSGGGQNEITVKCYESEDDYYKINVTPEGRLTIEKEIFKKWYKFLNFDFGAIKRNLTITIPSGLVADADIGSVSGNVVISNLDNLISLNGKSTSGNVRISKVSASDNTSFSSGSGNIILETVKTGGKLEMKTVSGVIETDLSDIGRDLIASTVSGGIKLTSIAVKGNVKADSVSGNIRLDRISGTDFTLKNTSGNVKGLISGNSNDYRIDSHSTSGKINLPRSQNGSKLLSVSTTSGDIDIDIRSAS